MSRKMFIFPFILLSVATAFSGDTSGTRNFSDEISEVAVYFRGEFHPLPGAEEDISELLSFLSLELSPDNLSGRGNTTVKFRKSNSDYTLISFDSKSWTYVDANSLQPVGDVFLIDKSLHDNRLFELLHLFNWIKVFVGERDIPPSLPTWFNDDLKSTLGEYFAGIGDEPPLYVKWLSNYFETLNKFKFRYGEEMYQDADYVKQLSAFLLERGYNISYHDFIKLSGLNYNAPSKAPPVLDYKVSYGPMSSGKIK